MKKILRVTIFFLLALVVLAVTFIIFLEIRGIPKYTVEKVNFPQVETTPERVALGAKIVAVQCAVCHRGADGKLSGRIMKILPKEFGEIRSTNITQSKEHGIGGRPDEEIAYLLRTGCEKDGQYLPIYMPKFVHLSDEDLKSVIAYLHSGAAEVQTSVADDTLSKPSLLVKFLCLVKFKKLDYPQTPVVAPDSNNAVAYGRYLVTGRYDCYACHSKDFKTCNMQFPEKSEGYMGGGNKLITQDGKDRYAANITMDEKTGIGTWNEQDLAKALRSHVNKAGKTIREPMLAYNGLTDLEVHSIWAYIQTIPIIENAVNRKWDEE